MSGIETMSPGQALDAAIAEIRTGRHVHFVFRHFDPSPYYSDLLGAAHGAAGLDFQKPRPKAHNMADDHYRGFGGAALFFCECTPTPAQLEALSGCRVVRVEVP